MKLKANYYVKSFYKENNKVHINKTLHNVYRIVPVTLKAQRKRNWNKTEVSLTKIYN